MNDFDKSIDKVAGTMSDQFIEFLEGNEALTDLMMDLAAEFVETKAGFISEDYQLDLATALLMRTAIRAY